METNYQRIRIKMSMARLFLLVAFICTALAAHGNGDENEEFFDIIDFEAAKGNEKGLEKQSEEEESMADYDDAVVLKSATFSTTGRRRVIWSGGASSYPGQPRRYRQNIQPRQVSSTYARPSTPRQRSQITIPLHNKKRAKDTKYREGLQDLADLM
ncbi:hypothetical protein Aperf_G00000115825 [Anoplocephala perfoliata]